MERMWPHEYFQQGFDALAEVEAKRQEDLLPVNQGEYAIADSMHRYFTDEVLPLILHDDWIFDAALEFASRYALECFRYWRLGSEEVSTAQTKLLELKDRIVDFIARADLARATLPGALDADLTKLRDYRALLRRNKLPRGMDYEERLLFAEVVDREELNLRITLRAIANNYAIILPRVMYVVRRAIKCKVPDAQKSKYDKLLDISESLDWYDANIDQTHALYLVFGELRDFYRIARNVANHPQDLEWDHENDQVILRDKSTIKSVHVDEFFQRHRYLVYLCEFGMRGILATFCEREHGPISNMVAQEYGKIFTEKYPQEKVVVRAYPVSETS